ncbi:DUF7619 domain-containing protein [Flavobacterium cerinum]|uniref:T9SS type A sorting domain-containing protein n=1 Tax=Flavobacterium cerinum TaxID=2502784 RepID=A0A3S3Q967_9FLAO|nr:T9SS type A sorting domain-containing protein [Flavobacterium cerinum]RWX00544.1 T9SS type A sorting domain-containing protein [Flavobacterium cerinum]
MKNKLLFLAVFLLLTLNGFSQAVANPAPNIQQCGFEVFNLTVQTPIILGNQNPNGFIVTYYKTQADAANGTNPIGNPTSFVSPQQQTIFAKVTNTTDGSTAITVFQINWSSGIFLPDMPNVTACEFYTLPALQQGNYFTGANGSGQIITIGTVITQTQTVYVFAQSGVCTDESSFVVTILAPPTMQTTPLYACDQNGDGFEMFNLSDIVPQIMGGVTDFTTYFFLTQADSENTNNAIINYDAFVNTVADSQTLYAMIIHGNCTWLVPFQISAIECTGNSISGFASLDLDGNGCDLFEAAAANMPVSYTHDNIVYTTYTNADGHYKFINVPDGVNTVTASPANMYTATPGSYSFTMPAVEEDANFCISPSEIINEVSVALVPTSQARPGFAASYIIFYENLGTVTANGTISLQFDSSKLTFVNTSPAMVLSGNTLTFTYSNLLPFQTKNILLNFTVKQPPVVNGQDVLVFTATINPASGDSNPVNNTSVLNQIVVNSYDPNDITVREGKYITEEQANEYLNYVVRFQNTGTADAINIRVTNTLDENLDWSTFQPIAASHDYKTNRTANEVEFLFDNIHLADSLSNEPASHGYIIYKIKPKADIALGDIMAAQAHIYFDFNPAIDTNTVTTTVQNVAGVKENTLINFMIYPNPASGSVNLKLNNIRGTLSEVVIADVLGKTILTSSIENNEADIDILSLRSGVYFITINMQGTKSTKKLIVK